ncbi:MAG TPA: methyltransferase domain-containing protein [bacterium]|nr:methyltransferase domain-containing protein [bacterium]
MSSATTAPALPPADRDAILARYRSRFAAHGPTVAALASGSEAKQTLRHRILTEIGDLQGASVIDLGCGLGHLLGSLEDRWIRTRYIGVDLVPEFIDHCRATYGDLEPSPAFIVGDLFADGCALIGSLPEADYGFASQVFNNRYAEANNWDLFRAAVTSLFGRCRMGVAVDCLTTRVDFQEPHLFYYNPADLLSFGLSLTRRAVLRHDYPLFEQTLYLYRE